MNEHTCDVSLGGDYDGDVATFYQEREVIARKSHRCFECRELIQIRDRYHVVSGKWDGEFRTDRFCAACWEIMGEFSETGRTFGVMWDVFNDEWNNGATLQGCLNRVSSVAAKALMTRKWRHYKKLD